LKKHEVLMQAQIFKTYCVVASTEADAALEAHCLFNAFLDGIPNDYDEIEYDHLLVKEAE